MKFNKFLILSAGALAVIGLASCNSIQQPKLEEVEAPITEVQEEPVEAPAKSNLRISNDKDIRNYIKNQNFDPEKIWKYDMSGSVKSVDPKESKMSGGRLLVTKKQLREAKSGTGSLHALQRSNLLYPGLLLKANSKLVEGTPTAITDLDRGKAAYELVLPGLIENTFSIEQCTGAGFRSKLNEKLAEWKALGKQLTANQNFSITQTYDASQLNVDLGFGVGEMLKIDSSYKQGVETNIFVVSFEQIFFSVNLDVELKRTIVFGDDCDIEDVKDECTDDAPPMIINQANYGQVIYFKVETESNKSKADITAAFNLAGKVDVKSKAEFNKMLSNFRVTCLISGGKADQYQNLTTISGDDSADKIAEILAKGVAPSAESVENAVMLSYSTMWLKNNDFARVQAATNYVETTYEYLNSQEIDLKNSGLFTVSYWKILARPITGWDKETGNPIFGNLEQLYYDSIIFMGSTRHFSVPANYGQVEFEFDAQAGRTWKLRRISNDDFFKSANIVTDGTTLSLKADITINK